MSRFDSVVVIGDGGWGTTLAILLAKNGVRTSLWSAFPANVVELTEKGGGKRRITADKAIVIATGSATIQVPGLEFDGETIIGAREAVSLRAIPEHLVVVGGGVIGL